MRTWAVTVCIYWLLALAALVSAQTRHKGTVHTPSNDPLIAREQITIEGGGIYTTDDFGQFDFDLVQNLKVGQPARFHVYHVNPAIRIKQWVVVKPCDLINGRKDALPDVSAEPISLVVLPKGDRRLISLNADYSILGCTIEEIAAEFKPSSAAAPSESGSFSTSDADVVASQTRDETSGNIKTVTVLGSPRVIEAAYRTHVSNMLDSPSDEDLPHFGSLDDTGLVKRAEELGFTPKELSDALDAWARSTQDSYERGLAALYNRRFAEASQYILKSIPSPPGEFLKRYVPFARAEYEQGHYPAAESALRKVLAVHGDDPIILSILGLVLWYEAKYSDAEPLLKQALIFHEKALGPDHPDVAIDLSNLAGLYRSQGKYADAEPLIKRAVAIDEKAWGPNYPDVAISLNNLAELYRSQGILRPRRWERPF